MRNRIEIHRGVFRHLDHYQAVYAGAAAGLFSADLVLAEQLPGRPGNGGGMCTYKPDGTKVGKGSPTGRGPSRKYVVAKKSALRKVNAIRKQQDMQVLQIENKPAGGAGGAGP